MKISEQEYEPVINIMTLIERNIKFAVGAAHWDNTSVKLISGFDRREISGPYGRNNLKNRWSEVRIVVNDLNSFIESGRDHPKKGRTDAGPKTGMNNVSMTFLVG